MVSDPYEQNEIRQREIEHNSRHKAVKNTINVWLYNVPGESTKTKDNFIIGDEEE